MHYLDKPKPVMQSNDLPKFVDRKYSHPEKKTPKFVQINLKMYDNYDKGENSYNKRILDPVANTNNEPSETPGPRITEKILSTKVRK